MMNRLSTSYRTPDAGLRPAAGYQGALFPAMRRPDAAPRMKSGEVCPGCGWRTLRTLRERLSGHCQKCQAAGAAER